MSQVALPKNLQKSLDKVLKEFKVDTDKKVDKGVRVAVIKTWGGIIKMTPVDSGRARNNWFITSEKPSEETTARVGTTKGGEYVTSQTKRLSVLDGSRWFLTNNLPYINSLEFGLYNKPGTSKTVNGYSKQAPRGMVRLNLLKWGKNLRNAFKAL